MTTAFSRFGIIIVAVLAAGLTACAGSGARREDARGADSIPHGTADQIAAAALRTWAVERDPTRAVATIARATEIDPDRPELLWLHIRLCSQLRGCDPAPLESRLRKLDATNGVAWFGVLERAQSRRDARAEQQILLAMSETDRFDLYWTTLVWRLSEGQRSSATVPSLLPLTSAWNDTVERLSALMTPAVKPVSAACTKERMKDPAIASSCQHIAVAMQRSDTTLMEALGIGIEQRLQTEGSPAAEVLEDRLATLTYQSQTAAAVIAGQLEREKFTSEMLELMQKLRREQDVWIAVLRWAGEPLTPDLP
jgi:hypothetical protein